MPINTPNPLYSQNIACWERCRDVSEGGDAIRAKGEHYLPKIEGQSEREYASYAKRPSFYQAVGHTLDAFTGAISRKPHKFDLPTRILAMEYDATADGTSLPEFIKQLCKEVLLQGRVGILVDFDDKLQQPCLAAYMVENITNWSDEQVILNETVYEPDPEDPFNMLAVEQYRQLWLSEGVCTVTVWRKAPGSFTTWIVHSEVVPKSYGKPLTALPFFWVTPLGPTSKIVSPPLMALVDLNLEHWRLSADLSHGLHFTGLPTFYITGADSDEPVKLGGSSAIMLKSADAKVGYAEFSGQGLGALERAITAVEQRMAAVGASVLAAEGRPANETALAANIRHSSETNLLTATVSAVQASLTLALKFAAAWVNANPDAVKIELNSDFVSARMDGKTLTGLVQAFHAGALTLGGLQTAMADGELIPQPEGV